MSHNGFSLFSPSSDLRMYSEAQRSERATLREQRVPVGLEQYKLPLSAPLPSSVLPLPLIIANYRCRLEMRTRRAAYWTRFSVPLLPY